VRWQAIPGVQPSILEDEWQLAQRVTTADPGWRDAMQKRGYSSFDTLFCAPFSAGYFADPAEEGRRLLKVACFDNSGGGHNVWGRPIEGLYAIVDLDEREVIRLIDTGPVPVGRDPADYTGTAPTAPVTP
jgi:primary-amine oxidase